MDLSFVIPTFNRPQILAETLDRLSKLDSSSIGEQAELIVIDNHSDEVTRLPASLSNGIVVRQIRLRQNIGAAARNVGCKHASADWVVMLDDDSSMLKCPAIQTLNSLGNDVHAVGGEIHLLNGKRESGGLPEIVVGCGCAYRRAVFMELGGYDQAFDYYAEEYDLCARVIRSGGRVVHHRGLQFEHRKSPTGRSFDRIIGRLVRNNGWVIKRYAPRRRVQSAVDEMIERYYMIAHKEKALDGYNKGLEELHATIDVQPNSEMSEDHWDRFTGKAAVKSHLTEILKTEEKPVLLVHPGKGEPEIIEVLGTIGCTVSPKPVRGGRLVIGTLSPGPMHDAKGAERLAIMPWAGLLPRLDEKQ
jgi:GT2 family glycosyltransferase